MKSYFCLSENVFKFGDYSIVPVQPDHIEQIRQWRNAQLDVLRQNSVITPEQQKDYYEFQIWPHMSASSPPEILMSYFKSNLLIGYGGLVHIAWRDFRAEISFLLDPSRTKNDIIYKEEFSIFLKLIKKLAFDELSFHRLFTETFDIRTIHIATLEASGFLREGVMRDHVKISNRRIDSIIHGCLESYER